MATLPGIGQIREAGAITVAEFDTYLPLLSLPRVFGTTPATIPATVPYIDIAALRRRKDLTALPNLSLSARPRVGVVWAGSPTYRNDRQRSCSLQDFAPVFETGRDRILQSAERRPSQGADAATAELPRRRPGALAARFWGHSAARRSARPGYFGGHGSGASCRCNGQTGVGAAKSFTRLALGARVGADAVVSDHAPVSADPGWRLGIRDAPCSRKFGGMARPNTLKTSRAEPVAAMV